MKVYTWLKTTMSEIKIVKEIRKENQIITIKKKV